MEFIPRLISPHIVAALQDTPVVVLNGPRQVGKTTLVRSLRPGGSTEYVTMDDPATRDGARLDPRGFVQRSVDTLVIDEAQLEPSLFRAIKAEVDLDRRPGRFLLTGSSRLLAAPDMAASLVGRVETLELWPLAQAELTSAPGRFVDQLFDEPQAFLRRGPMTRAQLVERVVNGGYPEAVARTLQRRAAWFDTYVTTLTQSVIRELSAVERLAEIPRLVRLCAARTGTELNVTALSNELGIPPRTADGYLTLLSTAFLIDLVPGWSTRISSKVVRRPKLFVNDSGLAAALQGTNAARLSHGPQLGPLLETFVANEIRRQLAWSDTRATLHHFRDRDGAEVDLLLEHPDGRVVGIEVKATSTPRSDDLRGLRYLADRLGDRFQFGALLSAAPEATPFGPKLAALPISALWAA